MSIEAVLIIPAFLLFLAMVSAIGRTALIQGDLHAAVVYGARVAAMATTPEEGRVAGLAAIKEHLNREDVSCLSVKMDVDASAVGLAPGQFGSVSATVSCVVPLEDLAIPGLPGQVTIETTFSTAINGYTNR